MVCNWSRPCRVQIYRRRNDQSGVLLGAEESGGIDFRTHPERDGIAAGLMLLELLATERFP